MFVKFIAKGVEVAIDGQMVTVEASYDKRFVRISGCLKQMSGSIPDKRYFVSVIISEEMMTIEGGIRRLEIQFSSPPDVSGGWWK